MSQFLLISNSNANCTITTSILSFVSYDFISIAANDTTSQLRILCDQNIAYAVKMDAGLNAANDFTRRQMRSSQSNTPLLYNLYLDASYSQIWGDGRGFTTFYRAISSGSPVVLPIYARLPSRQPVAAGIYTDSVVITIEW